MSSAVAQWFQNLADTLQHNTFLDRQVSTGYFGVPVATFGLVTIATAIFVHATFADEFQSAGAQLYAAAQDGLQRATDMVETAQEVVSDQASRMSEAISDAGSTAVEKTEEAVETVEEKVAEKVGGGGRARRRRRTTKRRQLK